jgi:hypothetical protein
MLHYSGTGLFISAAKNMLLPCLPLVPVLWLLYGHNDKLSKLEYTQKLENEKVFAVLKDFSR